MSMDDEIIGRFKRSAERYGLAAGSPLEVLAYEQVLKFARLSHQRRETTQAIFNPNKLAYDYCLTAARELAAYEVTIKRWNAAAKNERGTKPRKPTRTALAIRLSPDVGKAQACARLKEALSPLRLHSLNIVDPLA